VYPVLIGSELRPKDLPSALDIRGSRSRDDHPLIRVALRTAGYEGGASAHAGSEVRLGEPQKQRYVTARTERGYRRPGIGAVPYIVSTPVSRSETRDDNNTRPFTLSVVTTNRMLIVEGEAAGSSGSSTMLSAAMSRSSCRRSSSGSRSCAS
jgi:hypothetical protein